MVSKDRRADYIPSLFKDQERVDFLFHVLVKNSRKHFKGFSLKIEICDLKAEYSQKAVNSKKPGKRAKHKDHPLPCSLVPPNPNPPKPSTKDPPPDSSPAPPPSLTPTPDDLERNLEQINSYRNLLGCPVLSKRNVVFNPFVDVVDLDSEGMEFADSENREHLLPPYFTQRALPSSSLPSSALPFWMRKWASQNASHSVTECQYRPS